MIDNANVDLVAQGAADDPHAADLQRRYPKAIVRDLDAAKGRLTEADALIAYLQRLGTQVDFKLYDDKANIR
jgi:cytochrome c oxidase cbb3-type subunit 2